MQNMADFVIKNGVLKKYKGGDTSVEVPEGVTEIGKYAFTECDLRHIALPPTLKIIREYSLAHTKLEEIVVPEGVEIIGDGAFSHCPATSVLLPSSLRKIGFGAFQFCPNLYEVVIPEGVTEIGNMTGDDDRFFGSETDWCGAFANGRNLRRVVLPHSLRGIYYGAFRNTDIRKIEIPEGVRTIGTGRFAKPDPFEPEDAMAMYNGGSSGAFGDCFKLRKVILPKTLQTLDASAFGGSPAKLSLPDEILWRPFYTSEGNMLALLSRDWKDLLRTKDYAGIYLFTPEEEDELLKIAENEVNSESAAAANAMAEILRKDSGDAAFEKAAAFCITNRVAEQADIDKIYLKAMYAGAEKAAYMLLPDISAAAAEQFRPRPNPALEAEANAARMLALDPFTAVCKKKYNYREVERWLAKNKIPLAEFAGLYYMDTGYEVSPIVAEYALVSSAYQYELEIKENGFAEKDRLKDNFHRLYKCRDEEIAKRVNPDDLGAMAQRLADFSEERPPKRVEMLIPLAEYGSRKQIKDLIGCVRAWAKRGEADQKAAHAVFVANSALLLSYRRIARQYAEEIGALRAVARMEGISLEELHNEEFTNFDFDPDGKMRYDLGATTLEVYIGGDLNLVIYDTKAGKVIDRVPTEGVDPKAAAYAAEDIAQTAAELKIVFDAKIAELKAQYDSDYETTVKDIKPYANSPFDFFRGCNAVEFAYMKPFVWEYDRNPYIPMKSFMVLEVGEYLGEGKMLDEDGNVFPMDNNCRSTGVSIARPGDLPLETVEKWRKYIKERNIFQPFEQFGEG